MKWNAKKKRKEKSALTAAPSRAEEVNDSLDGRVFEPALPTTRQTVLVKEPPSVSGHFKKGPDIPVKHVHHLSHAC